MLQGGWCGCRKIEDRGVMHSLYPLRFKEIFKEKIWGGRNLADLFGKALPPGELIGESWEVSDREGDQSVVAAGPLEGATLHELVTRYGDRLVGTCPLAKTRFPFLKKRYFWVSPWRKMSCPLLF